MLSLSLPTLKAMTARTFKVIPCWVTHLSSTSASHIAKVRNRTFRKNGMMKAP